MADTPRMLKTLSPEMQARLSTQMRTSPILTVKEITGGSGTLNMEKMRATSPTLVAEANTKVKTYVADTIIDELPVLWVELPEEVRGKSQLANADLEAVKTRVRELASTAVDSIIEEEKDPLRKPFVKVDPKAAYDKTITAFLGDSSIAEFADAADKKRKRDLLLKIGLGVGGVALLGFGIYTMRRTPEEGATL